MNMGLVIRTEINEETEQQVMEDISPKGQFYELEELYEICGCTYVTTLPVMVDGFEKLMVMDEEGDLRGKPPNHEATRILWDGNIKHKGYTILVGDVAIIDPKELD